MHEPAPGGEKETPPENLKRSGVFPGKAGFRIFSVESVDANRSPVLLDVALFYPTGDPERNQVYRFGPHALETRIAACGDVAKGRYPLVVYSHGASGSAVSSVFLCEALARAGWIVAAPDHTNEVSAVRLRSRPARISIRFDMFASTVWNTLVKGTGPALKRLGHRTRQLRDVIDACLRPGGHAFFLIDRVDTGRIGVIGHSFGGWTALLTAGAVNTEAHPSIRAAVSLSAPVARNIFTPAEIASIRVPVMFQAGTHEWPLEQYKRVHFDPCPPPKYLVQIAGAGHRSFTCGFDPDFPSVSRLLEDPVRAAVTATAIDFLSSYLKDDAAAGRRLRCHDYPGVHRMLRDMGEPKK